MEKCCKKAPLKIVPRARCLSYRTSISGGSQHLELLDCRFSSPQTTRQADKFKGLLRVGSPAAIADRRPRCAFDEDHADRDVSGVLGWCHFWSCEIRQSAGREGSWSGCGGRCSVLAWTVRSSIYARELDCAMSARVRTPGANGHFPASARLLIGLRALRGQ